MTSRHRSYQQRGMVSPVLDLAVTQAIDLLSRLLDVGTSINGTLLSEPTSGGPLTLSQPNDTQLALCRSRILIAHHK